LFLLQNYYLRRATDHIVFCPENMFVSLTLVTFAVGMLINMINAQDSR